MNLLLDFKSHSRISDHKAMKLLLDFWLFSRILDQKGVNLLTDIWFFFYEYETRKQWTYCSLQFSRNLYEKGMSLFPYF